MTIEKFDFNINVSQVLEWQYNNALKLQQIIENEQTWNDEYVNQFINDWYNNVFNLDTANDFGLQVWAIILGVHFDLATVTVSSIGVLGYDVGQNFDNATFAPDNSTYLTTSQKRLILQLRYSQMTTNATIDSIYSAVNRVLSGAMVYDNLDMSINVALPTYPDFYSQFILDNYDIIPKPAGVKLNYEFGTASWFGFNGSNGNGFDNSTFQN